MDIDDIPATGDAAAVEDTNYEYNNEVSGDDDDKLYIEFSDNINIGNDYNLQTTDLYCKANKMVEIAEFVNKLKDNYIVFKCIRDNLIEQYYVYELNTLKTIKYVLEYMNELFISWDMLNHDDLQRLLNLGNELYNDVCMIYNQFVQIVKNIISEYNLHN